MKNVRRIVVLIVLGLVFPSVAPATTTGTTIPATTVGQTTFAYDADMTRVVSDNALTDSEASSHPVPTLGQIAKLDAAKSEASIAEQILKADRIGSGLNSR